MLKIIDKCDILQKRRDIEGIKCCICNTDDTSIRNDGRPRWYECNCGEEDCTGYYCNKCYMKKYNVSENGIHTTAKNLANCRTGNLDRISYRGVEVLGQWICAKVLSLEDMNIKNDNFAQLADLSHHVTYGNIDVKTCTLIRKRGIWKANVARRTFNTVALLCMDGLEIWEDVKKMFIIPEDKIKVSSCLTVYDDPLGQRQIEINKYYEIFRVDEKPYNDIYHSVSIPRFFSPWDLWKGKYDKLK